MTTIGFIGEIKRLIPYWKKYQQLAKENVKENEIDPVNDFKCRQYAVYRLFEGTPSLLGWCPFVLFRKALEWELCLDKYMETL